MCQRYVELQLREIELEPLDIRHTGRLRELHEQPGVLRWWGPMNPMFPFDEPESQRFAIAAGGEIVGMVQYGEEDNPEYHHAYIDIFVGDDFSGRGIGTEAIRRVLRALVDERGHHHVMIDPASDNAAAIRCYEKAGFEPVGIRKRFTRESPQAEWRDELLMQYVVDSR